MEWRKVLERYDDPSVHDAFINAYASVDHLEEAARYYREHLEQNPGDVTARARLDQISARATLAALSGLDDTARETRTPVGRWLAAIFASRSERVNLFAFGATTLLIGVFGALRSADGEGCGGLLKGSIVCLVKDLMDLASTWSLLLIAVGSSALVLYYRVSRGR